MSIVLLAGGVYALVDAFGAPHFGVRQEWEIAVGIALLVIAGLAAIFED